jgi:uncharacterized membrane protein YdbT with pleckstrin-like domain
MKFRPKKDILFFSLIWGSITGVFWIEITSTEHSFTALLFRTVPASCIIIFLIWIWFGTSYTIQKNELFIQYGPFRWRIPIESIKSIQKVNSPFTAPCLSLKRLEIHYQKFKGIQVSPEDQEKFIKNLIERNPAIKIKTH